MAQTAALVRALKNVLKARGMTYAQLAKGLHLSEASVKRVFAQHTFTLERLDQICDFVGVEISDLARIVAHEAQSPVQLTWQQEKEVVSDPKLLLVAVHALNHWTMDDIMGSYALSKVECTRLLAKLDRLGIIDLMPDNKIRVKVARGFRWLRAHHVGHDSFDSHKEFGSYQNRAVPPTVVRRASRSQPR